METFLQDLRYAARMLVKRPAFTLVAVLSLTLGIGANSTIFTLTKAVFLQTIAVKDPSSVMVVFSSANNVGAPQQQYLPISYLNARDIREKNDVLSGTSVFIGAGANLIVSGKQVPVFCPLVNGDFFDILGIQPELGRWFRPEEDGTPGANPVAVISHGLWKRQFGGDANIVGQTIRLSGQPFSVIGVAPSDFHDLGIFGSPDVFIPIAMHGPMLTGIQKDWFDMRGARMTLMVGRLKPGVSFRRAETSLRNFGEILQREFPKENGGRGVMVMPIADTVIPPQQHGDFVRAGMLMGVIVGLVLLIACANVANLLLARATQRQREIAIRLSMGASRARLLRQLLTESLLLGLIAGALAVGCAFGTRSLITKLLPNGLPNNLDFSVDGKVLLFTLGLSLIATMLFGLMPALQTSRKDRLAALRDRTDVPTGSTRWYGLRGVLVMVQVALSLIALVGAGLFIHSLSNAQRIDTGFEVHHELTILLNVAAEHYPQAKAEQLFQDATDRVRALPMVANAGISDHAPFTQTISRTAFTENVDGGDPRNGRIVPISAVEPGFFSAAGMTLLRGRDFNDHDDAQSPMVAVVNQAAAQQFWPGQDPLGRHLRFFLTTWDVNIVGVVNTVKYQTLGEPPQAIVYFPLKQQFMPAAFLWVRTKTDPNAALASVRSAVQSLAPTLPLNRVRPVAQDLDQSLAAPRLGAELLGGFGLLALVLAAVGTYGVMSYSVSQRTQEIGIRMAMGAKRLDVLRLIVATGMAMVSVGIVAGLALSSALARTMSTLLYDVGIFDAPSFLGTATLLVAVALVACLIPARRAARVDPMVALRYE
jgi:predicted permease